MRLLPIPRNISITLRFLIIKEPYMRNSSCFSDSFCSFLDVSTLRLSSEDRRSAISFFFLGHAACSSFSSPSLIESSIYHSAINLTSAYFTNFETFYFTVFYLFVYAETSSAKREREFVAFIKCKTCICYVFINFSNKFIIQNVYSIQYFCTQSLISTPFPDPSSNLLFHFSTENK